MPRAVLISAVPVESGPAALLRPDDRVIACDAGWRSCARLGITPELIVGDFDSAERPQTNVPVIVLPHEKDDTDTHFAARKAVEMGAGEVLMLGALGGARIEHTLANLATALWLERQGVSATLADARSRITFVRPGAERVYARGAYQYLSLFPAEGRAAGVSIRGAQYPLTDAVLDAAFPLGVSNEFAADAVTVSVRAGYLTVVETLPDT